MNKTLKISIAVVVVALLVAAGIWWIQSQDEDEVDTQQTEEMAEEETVVSEPGEIEGEPGEIHTVAFDETDGFSPQEITVNVGDTVVFRNMGSEDMWVASDDHPTHEELPEFDADGNVEPGEEYPFTFEQSGTWSYHDHREPDLTGTVIVE